MPENFTRTLIDVVMGRTPADLVLRKGTWVCVQSDEFVPDTDIAIKDGRIDKGLVDVDHLTFRPVIEGPAE